LLYEIVIYIDFSRFFVYLRKFWIFGIKMLKFEQKLPFLSCTYEGEDVLARPPRPPSSCDAPLLARGGVLPHGYIPGCCCSSCWYWALYWADMPTPLGAWVLVNAKALGPQEGS